MNKTYSSKSNARRATIKAGNNPDNMIHVVEGGRHSFEAKPTASNGKANTKARQVRAIIANEYSVTDDNSAEIIARLQEEFNFGKSLATRYFTNNLAKLQA